MGDTNQLLYIRKHADRLDGPYLEIGARDYGSTVDLRPLFAGRGEYVGVDMQAGPGVDLVLDLTSPFEAIDAALRGRRFGTVFCLSVLEHCEQPFRMADTLVRLLKPGGALCLAAPFAWQFHGYPSDYWRFTHEGIRKLFPGLQFDDQLAAWATSRPGDFHPLSEDLGLAPLGSKWHRRRGHPLRAISAKLLSLGASIGLLRWLAGHPYVLTPTQVLMIGVK